MTGTSSIRSLRAAAKRAWPAITTPSGLTRIGLVHPNSTMLAATCATCSSVCVRAFRAYGINLSMGQIWTTRSRKRGDAPPMLATSRFVVRDFAVMPELSFSVRSAGWVRGAGCAQRRFASDSVPGEQVAAREFGDFADVAEAGSHHHRLVAEMFVVVVDGGDGLNARVVRAGVVLARVLLVPIENAADERRDQRDLRLRRRNCLVQAEEQGQVA